MDCDHEKVYAEYWYLTNPPQTPWICEKCGEKGMETGKIQRITYEDLIKKFQTTERG